MTPTPLRRALRLTAVVALAMAPLAACGDDDDAGSTITEPAVTEPAAASIEVTGAWARTSPAMATAGAVYFEIANIGDADDAFVGVSVDASVAARAEIHETTAADDAMDDDDAVDDDSMGEGSGTTMGGMMDMRPVDEIVLPAGETVVLEPGGYHIMLLDLTAPLEAGATVEVTLSFETADDVVVEAEVRDMAP